MPAVRCRLSRLLIVAAVALPAASALAADERTGAAEPSTATAAATTSRAWHGAQDVASFALGLIGVDYRFGGTEPQTGLDCSGFVRYVFAEVTGVSLPRTSKDQSRLGRKVALGELAPGDLVFFNTRNFAFSHVGLYLGGDRFIHAPSRGGEVRISALTGYWKARFSGARRLVGVLPALVPGTSATSFSLDGLVEMATATLPQQEMLALPASDPSDDEAVVEKP
jgi:cell wall-associated NlpC family hydrolase